MIGAHFLGDYPWQAGPIGVEKNLNSKSELQKQVPWGYWLTAHAYLHGILVSLVSVYFGGPWWIGIFEFLIHWFVDYYKCKYNNSILSDQAIHIICKLIWSIFIILYLIYVKHTII